MELLVNSGVFLQDILCVFHSGLRKSTNPEYGMKMPLINK